MPLRCIRAPITLMPSENTFASPRKRWISPVRVTLIFTPFSALRWGTTSSAAVELELDELHPETATNAVNKAAHDAAVFILQKTIFYPPRPVARLQRSLPNFPPNCKVPPILVHPDHGKHGEVGIIGCVNKFNNRYLWLLLPAKSSTKMTATKDAINMAPDNA